MNTKQIFSVQSARSSVIDLAAKCKLLRSLRTEILTRKRSGEKDPTVLWDAGTPEEKQIGFWAVEAKRGVRSGCSRTHQLAYAFIRGVPYRAVEAKASTFPLYEIVEVLEEHLSEEGKKLVRHSRLKLSTSRLTSCSISASQKNAR